jgi:hypothetical protein
VDTLKAEFLFDLSADLEVPQEIGATPHGIRRIIYVQGGTVSGPKLKGEVLRGFSTRGQRNMGGSIGS